MQKDTVAIEKADRTEITRAKAVLIHLGGSACIALLSALLVFLVWYPFPYSEISGGRRLFLWVAGVDVVMGPLITLVIFNPGKSWRELRFDLIVIAALQFSALAYGVGTVYQARPVALVFEYDRLSVVHASDMDAEMLANTPAASQLLTWAGPTLVALRPFRDNSEQMEATLAALAGAPLAARVDLWQPYERSLMDIQRRSEAVLGLLKKFPQRRLEIEAAVRKTGLPTDALRGLPLVGRNAYWTVLIEASTGRPVGFVAIDTF